MMRAQSGVGFSGGGIGLKSAGVLAQSAVPASVTGTLSETTLATIAIPAGAMGVNGALRISTLWSYTNSANNKTLKIVLGGVQVQGITVTTSSAMNHIAVTRNRGAANSQITQFNSGAPFNVASQSNITTAVDTSQAQNLTITGTLANTGETITLEGYTVELLNP